MGGCRGHSVTPCAGPRGPPTPPPSPQAPKPRRSVPGGGGETAGPHAGHRWLRAGPKRRHKAQARGTPPPHPRVDLCCEAKKRLPCLPAAHGPRFPGCRHQLLGAPGQPRPGRGLASSSRRGRSGPCLLPHGTPSSPQDPRAGMQGPQGPVLHPQSKKASLSPPRHPGPGEPSADKEPWDGASPRAGGPANAHGPGQPPEWGPSPWPLWLASLATGGPRDTGRRLCQSPATVLRRPNKEGRDGTGRERAAPGGPQRG